MFLVRVKQWTIFSLLKESNKTRVYSFQMNDQKLNLKKIKFRPQFNENSTGIKKV